MSGIVSPVLEYKQRRGVAYTIVTIHVREGDAEVTYRSSATSSDREVKLMYNRLICDILLGRSLYVESIRSASIGLTSCVVYNRLSWYYRFVRTLFHKSRLI